MFPDPLLEKCGGYRARAPVVDMGAASRHQSPHPSQATLLHTPRCVLVSGGHRPGRRARAPHVHCGNFLKDPDEWLPEVVVVWPRVLRAGSAARMNADQAAGWRTAHSGCGSLSGLWQQWGLLLLFRKSLFFAMDFISFSHL